MGYLAWWVLTGKHYKITLMMQFPGHTKCLVDAGFGQAKKLFRRSNCDTIDQLAEIFNKSSSINEAVLFKEDGNDESTWQWHDWKTFLNRIFKPIANVKKYHHFIFRSDKPGVVIVKEKCDAPEKEVRILRVPLDQFDQTARPNTIVPAGLSEARQQYLYSTVRPLVRIRYRDAFCPTREEE